MVVGIDVGGRRKGFHAVALGDADDLVQFQSRDTKAVVSWCRDVDASVVAVDAPCRWSKTGRARPAERDLMKNRIWCFSTPTLRAAQTHPNNHFGWMLRGAELFEELEKYYELFRGNGSSKLMSICFETYPQAIACALAGEVISTKRKATVRKSLLAREGVRTNGLANVDSVDAALCALTALRFLHNRTKAYGEPDTGLIVVPA
jgi:predicted nuclease with RNAse H fold